MDQSTQNCAKTPAASALNPQPSTLNPRLHPWLGPGVLALAYLALTVWSWGKWPDLLVDFGQMLEVPWRMSQGELPYRDFPYIMGPVSQMAHAGLFWLCGPSLRVLVLANLALVAGLTWLIWHLARPATDRLTATLLGLAFLGVFAFSQYTGVGNYNFVTPYRYEQTHGLSACLLLILVLLRFDRQPRWPWAGLAGLLLGLTIMLKAEIAVAAGGVAGLALLLLAWRPANATARWTVPGRLVLGLAVGAALVVGLCWLCFMPRLGAGPALAAIFTNWRLALQAGATADEPFFQRLSGFDLPGAHLARLLLVGAVQVVIVALLVGVERVLGRRGPAQPRWLLAAGMALGLGALCLPWRAVWFEIGRAWPLLCLLAGGLGLWRWARAGHDAQARQQALLLTLWSGLSGALLLRMLLNVRLDFYGFVLALPATLLALALLLHGLPAALRACGLPGQWTRALALALALAFIAAWWRQGHEYYRGKTLVIGQGADAFRHDPAASPRNQLLPELLPYLARRLPADATLTIMPEAGMYGFLLRRRNPTPYYLLNPWEYNTLGGDPVIRATLARTRPDCLVLLSIDMKEYGKRYFGDPGYGAETVAWIREQYQVDKVFSIRDAQDRPAFQIAIFVRPGLPWPGGGSGSNNNLNRE